MLRQFGLTADEWGDLPADVRHFHERAEAEYRQREREQHDDNEL